MAMTGRLKGRVIDESGLPLPGANIVVDSGTQGAETDNDGYYYILNLKPGSHKVSCNYIGFQTITYSDVIIRVNQTLELNFTLNETDLVLEEVVFSSSRFDVLNKEITTSQRVIDLSNVKLSASSDFNSVLTRQAGVQEDSKGELHFRGGRSGEVNYMIDGIEISDPTGKKGKPVELNFESIESFSIQKGIPNAEYGNALSGSVNIVMKSGEEKNRGQIKYSTDSFISDGSLDLQQGELNFSGPIPFWFRDTKPSYFFSADLTSQNGNLKSFKNIDDEWYDFGDDDLTGFGFKIPVKRENSFNYSLKTTFELSNDITFSLLYSKSRSINFGYDINNLSTFNYTYFYTPETSSKAVTDVDMIIATWKHMLTKSSFIELSFSWLNRSYEYLPGGKKPEEFDLNVISDDFFAHINDVNNNSLRDGGDCEPYVDVNKNGYFDREYFIDLDNNGIYNSGEDFVDANYNGFWDGDSYTDTNENKMWDYWENGHSYTGFYGGTFTTLGGETVEVTHSRLEDVVVEGYKDNNSDGHYKSNIYMDPEHYTYDEPYEDGDLYTDTGEPFIDEERWYQDSSSPIGYTFKRNGKYEDYYSLRIDKGVFNSGVPSGRDTLVIYDQEIYLDLMSTKCLSTMEIPINNFYYDGPNGVFDEYEAYIKKLPLGAQLPQNEIGWVAGHTPYDAMNNDPEIVKYVQFNGTYSTYKAPVEEFLHPNKITEIELNEYSKWIDRNRNNIVDLADSHYNSGENYFDMNGDGEWNRHNNFILPGYYYKYENYSKQKNTIYKFKGSFSSQLDNFNFLKFGGEFSYNKLDYYELRGVQYNFDPASGYITDENDPYPLRGFEKIDYDYAPIELAFYGQNKLEFEDLVVNAGVRYDARIHDSDAENYYKTLHNSNAIGYSDDFKRYIGVISPRLGVSHSITDKQKLFFSYGHLYQLPTYTKIYEPNAKSNDEPLFGNMNLEYEKNVQYELGIVTEVDQYLIDVTGYFKDIYDMINTKTYIDGTLSASTYYNMDYGKTRGIEISIDKRVNNLYTWGITYAYSYAYGKASSDVSNYNAAVNNNSVNIKEFPLDWDERHAINLYLSFLTSNKEFFFQIPYTNDISLSFNSNFGSGKPFTPTTEYYDFKKRSDEIETNEGRKPWTSTTDFKFTKKFDLNSFFYGSMRLDFEIYNLFDKVNVLEVYPNTGSWKDPGENILEENPSLARFYANPNNIGPARSYKMSIAYNW